MEHLEDGRAGMRAGWEVKSLGEVLEIRNGRNQREVESTDGEFPIYGSAGNVMGMATDYICEAGTTIIGRKGSINNPIFATTRFWNVDTAFGLSPKQGLNSRYLYYYCLSYDFNEHNRGTTIPSLVKSELLGIKIPLPPLAEQQRIVAILDEAFEGIATARKHAEQNLQNAKALFESHLEAVFNSQWQTSRLVPLSELTTDITDGDHLPPPKSQIGVPFITIGNIIKKSNKVDFRDTFMVPRAYYDALKDYRKPRMGDVLYTVTGSFGIPVIVESDSEFCFQRHIGLVRPKSDVSSSWLFYLLKSPQVMCQANEGATGTAQKTVSLKLLRNFVVPKVSHSQQVKDIHSLDALRDETNRLCDIYTQKIAALDALKKSLIHQAFSGEL